MTTLKVHPKIKNAALDRAIKELKEAIKTTRGLYCLYSCHAVKRGLRSLENDPELKALLPAGKWWYDDLMFEIMKMVAPKNKSGEHDRTAWLSGVLWCQDSYKLNKFRMQMLLAMKNKKGHVKYRKFVQRMYDIRNDGGRVTNEDRERFKVLAKIE